MENTIEKTFTRGATITFRAFITARDWREFQKVMLASGQGSPTEGFNVDMNKASELVDIMLRMTILKVNGTDVGDGRTTGSVISALEELHAYDYEEITRFVQKTFFTPGAKASEG